MIIYLDAKGKQLDFRLVKPEAGCPQISGWRSKCVGRRLSGTVRSLEGPYRCVFKQCIWNVVELQDFIGGNCFGIYRFP